MYLKTLEFGAGVAFLGLGIVSEVFNINLFKIWFLSS